MDSSHTRMEVKQVEPVHMFEHLWKSILHLFSGTNPQNMSAVVATAKASDEGLKQEMRQMVDMMKDLSLSLLSNQRNGRGRERPSNQGGDGQPRPAGGGQRNWKYPPTCYNCGEVGHISPQCDKPPRMGGDVYPLPCTASK